MKTNMKRYVFLLGSLKKGGAERNMARLSSALSEAGHDVHLILFQNQVDYPLHGNVKIHELSIKKYRLPLVSQGRLLYKLTRKVWQLKPHYAIGFARIGSQMLAMTGFPRVIARFDTYPFSFQKKKWMSAVACFNLPNVRYVVCPSRELEEDARPYFTRKSKLVTICNPVADVSGLVKGGATVEPGARPYFIVVARLTQQKQIETIIKAFAKAKVRESMDVVILGEGNQEQVLKKLVADLGLTDSIHFKGFVFEPYRVMQGAYALLSSSIKEGFPNVVVEALSLGVPVISSDCKTGPKEIITDGKNGFLFPVGNVDRLAELMDTIATDGALYNRLKAQAKPSVTRFEGPIIQQEWDRLLDA